MDFSHRCTYVCIYTHMCVCTCTAHVETSRCYCLAIFDGGRLRDRFMAAHWQQRAGSDKLNHVYLLRISLLICYVCISGVSYSKISLGLTLLASRDTAIIISYSCFILYAFPFVVISLSLIGVRTFGKQSDTDIQVSLRADTDSELLRRLKQLITGSPPPLPIRSLCLSSHIIIYQPHLSSTSLPCIWQIFYPFVFSSCLATSNLHLCRSWSVYYAKAHGALSNVDSVRLGRASQEKLWRNAFDPFIWRRSLCWWTSSDHKFAMQAEAGQ